jgi:hypothetical protein
MLKQEVPFLSEGRTKGVVCDQNRNTLCELLAQVLVWANCSEVDWQADFAEAHPDVYESRLAGTRARRNGHNRILVPVPGIRVGFLGLKPRGENFAERRQRGLAIVEPFKDNV